MKVFWSEEKSLLISTPFKCGSSYLRDNMVKFNLMEVDLRDEEAKKFFKQLTNQAEKKIFLCRDPLDRYLSVYHWFCFGIKPGIRGWAAEASARLLYLLSSEKSDDFWEEVFYTMPNLEKNVQADHHIRPQYSYFIAADENIKDYHVFDVKNYRKIIYDNFGENVPEHKNGLNDIPINYKTSLYLIQIQNLIEKIYADDYSKIRPLVMDL